MNNEIVEDENLCPYCRRPMAPDGWHFCRVEQYPMKKLEEKFDPPAATTRLDTSA